VQSDKVDFIVGYIWSNCSWLAEDRGRLEDLPDLGQCRSVAARRRTCSPNFLDLRQNDQTPARDGLLHDQKGVKSCS